MACRSTFSRSMTTAFRSPRGESRRRSPCARPPVVSRSTYRGSRSAVRRRRVIPIPPGATSIGRKAIGAPRGGSVAAVRSAGSLTNYISRYETADSPRSKERIRRPKPEAGGCGIDFGPEPAAFGSFGSRTAPTVAIVGAAEVSVCVETLELEALVRRAVSRSGFASNATALAAGGPHCSDEPITGPEASRGV